MNVRYIVAQNKIEDESDYIELLLCDESISDNEKNFLKENNIKYDYINNTVKIYIDNFYGYYTEIGIKEEGIYFEKTERYYNYLKNVMHITEIEEIRNLIISKNGIKIEVII